MVKRHALVIACACTGVAAKAHAQVSNAGVLDQALDQYRVAAESWQNAAQGAATTLFWSLAAISLTWTMGQLVLRRAELGEVFAELIRYLLFTGFWAWMLANGPAHAQLIVDSMVRLASSASAQNRLTPSGVLDVGFHILDRALTQSTITSPLTSAIGIVVALGILIVLALTAVNMLVSLIACWIVAYGGLIVLGFGGSRWTSDMAINYYRMVLSLGLQVLAMILLVGMGESFLRSYFNRLEPTVSVHELAVLLVVSLVLLVTVNRIPALLGTLANGSSPQYSLGSGAGAGAAMSALSTIGGLAAWSSVAGKTAADSAGSMANSAGSLARAMAAATTSGASSAMTSLLDGFRSAGGAERSSGTVAGAGGGSVFPAPGTASSSSGTHASSSDAGVQPSQAIRRAHGGAAHARTGAPSAAHITQPSANAAEKAGAGAAIDSQRVAAADRRSRERNDPASGAAARHSPPPAKADASSARVDASTVPGPHHRKSERATAQDGRGLPDGSSKTTKHEASTASASPKRAESASSRVANDPAVMPAASTISAPGTFTHGPAPGSVSGSTAVPPVQISAPSSPMTQSISSGASIAAAGRPLSPQQIPFAVGSPTDPTPQVKAQTPAAPPEPSDGTELPSAYSQQTAVDVDAEIAAFRDQE